MTTRTSKPAATRGQYRPNQDPMPPAGPLQSLPPQPPVLLGIRALPDGPVRPYAIINVNPRASHMRSAKGRNSISAMCLNAGSIARPISIRCISSSSSAGIGELYFPGVQFGGRLQDSFFTSGEGGPGFGTTAEPETY